MDNPNLNTELFKDLFDKTNVSAKEQPVQEPVPMPEQTQEVIQAERIPKNKSNNVQVAQNQTQIIQDGPSNVTKSALPQTDGSTEQNLAILMCVKETYTNEEWKQRYVLYGSECQKIQVDSFNLTTSDVAIAAGRIDNLLTPVRLDYADINARLAVYELQLKIAEQTAFKQVYDDFTNKNLKLPPIDDRKAMSTALVKAMKRPEESLNLYELRERYSARSIQIESILKILQDKKDLLITYSAALKIENTTNNFTPNVPTNGQLNQMRS